MRHGFVEKARLVVGTEAAFGENIMTGRKTERRAVGDTSQSLNMS